MNNSFKWLHLSDFHTGKDDYGQRKLFTYLHKHMSQNKENGYLPDAIFITGDIADKGLTEEYDMFIKEFMEPLVDIYGTLPRIYMVPGNHDINRKERKQAAKSLYSVLEEAGSRFFDADGTGLNERKEIIPRFENFQNCIEKVGEDICFPVKGIFDEKGAFTDILPIGQKKVGIIGINTAWLSCSDMDKEKLTPGKYIVEEALDAVKDCEYKIVLGHHPLDWLQGDQRRQIEALLTNNKAMYLHGHMHENSGDFLMQYRGSSLILQSGAAFQVREDEKYYNSLQWGELDDQRSEILIRPKRWAKERQEFVMDSSDRILMGRHKDGQDYWQFPYAISIQEEPSKQDQKLIKSLMGWNHIDQRFIMKRQQPSDDEILKYFDGKEPDYNAIFSSRIPMREIVKTITKDYLRCNEDQGIKCGLIIGAGGEGKTTVLLQTVRELTEKYHWQALVLKYADKNTQIPIDEILRVTKRGNWIICADNCFPVADKLFHLLEELSKQGRRHVHLLLCARKLDWKNHKANQLKWSSYSSYTPYKLRGIGAEDAKTIVTAWANLGEKGLGKLSKLSITEATQKLCLSAKDETTKSDSDEGTLLGAMLTVRYGEGLDEHVHNLLLRLKEIPIRNTSLNGSTLLDVYAYIAAMHSEGFNLLYKEVIAQLYGLSTGDVRKNILVPLGDEAATAVSGEVVYTRHIFIAQAACRIMEEEFDYDFDEIFVELGKAAMEVIIQTGVRPEYVEWKYLGDHFMEKNRTLALRLYQIVLDKSPKDPQMTVHLSGKYRKLGWYDKALALFRDEEENVDHRSFFCEWALVEAIVGQKTKSVCLSALSLSDGIATKPLDKETACKNLHAVANTFYELNSQNGNDDYQRFIISAIRLGERIDKNDVKIKKFIQNTFPKLDARILAENLDYEACLQKGIAFAAQNAELEFKSWIPSMDTLRFKRLFAMAKNGDLAKC